jgi:hypothetical protein
MLPLFLFHFQKVGVLINFIFNLRDIILEAKATELMCWTCSFCSLSVPHMHVHKVILWSSCDYMQALFQSGMQDRCIYVFFFIYLFFLVLK